jgi:hypothetical protein
MDQAFLLRAQKLLDQRQPARLDHAALLAAVTARQAASPSAQAAARAATDIRPPTSEAPLVLLLLAAPEWREAARAQCGCFNRAVAARGVNIVETPLTGIFTTAL